MLPTLRLPIQTIAEHKNACSFATYLINQDAVQPVPHVPASQLRLVLGHSLAPDSALNAPRKVVHKSPGFANTIVWTSGRDLRCAGTPLPEIVKHNAGATPIFDR